MTGRENLRFTGRLNGLSGDFLEQRIEELLERVGMTEEGVQKSRDLFQRYEAKAGDCRCFNEYSESHYYG